MPQTRFVLRKALALEKKVIVVVNKIDRPAARCRAASPALHGMCCFAQRSCTVRAAGCLAPSNGTKF